VGNRIVSSVIRKKKEIKMTQKALTIGERFALLGILPKQGDYLTIKKTEELRSRLLPDDEETKNFSIKTVGETITWQNSLATAEIEIGEVMEQRIKEILRDRSSARQLLSTEISIYEKFVEDTK
jgi:hypothetical protein